MLLTVALLLGTFASFAVFEVAAADTTTDSGADSGTDKPEQGPSAEELLEETVMGYLSTEYVSPQHKLSTMELKLDKDGYQLYVDPLTGETATVNKESGQILFSNPWDIKGAANSDNIAGQLMSQVYIKYTDNGTEKHFYSFFEAAIRGQIKVKNIKNGVRVEYIIGREEARKLVPRTISKTRFESIIKPFVLAAFDGNEDDWNYKRFIGFFNLVDPENEKLEEVKQNNYRDYPITKIKPIYALDTSTSTYQMAWLEEMVKAHCPHYTYEELDWDHEDTLYVGTDTNPPLFKMAIEYTLDEYGMSWRMPANGLRFDESLYKLTFISVLPYLGAGANYGGYDKTNLQDGYTFFPDGSGALFDFQKLNTKNSMSITSKVYGADYAYHDITGGLSEVIRYPVFGIVEQQKLNISNTETVIKTEAVLDPITGDVITPAETEEVTTTTPYAEDKGFVAIVEEGDALAEIQTNHESNHHKYNSIQLFFYPRPRDSYNIADAISVGQNKTWTVVSSRKYVGSYKVRYIMLTDDKIAQEKGITDYYPCSWMGMARAYADYLEDNGVLTRLTEDDILDNIPLYIETFGTFETLEKILSIPVNVMTPLTTFKDIVTMYEELKADGISNINFKLTGFANGGYYSSVPYKLKWEKAVGGNSGFEELIAYAKDSNASGEHNLGIFPDFDFVYAQYDKAGDGLSLKKHAVKTIDDRYTSKRVYSATYQSYESYFQLALSPAYFEYFYDAFTERYLKYDPIGISVSTLGSDLNSDFDEDEPYNREDSKAFTANIFKRLSEDYGNVMTDNGNAFIWKYANHIIDVPLDSSRYIKAAHSVPFMGTVLHGYVQIAGTPYNMEGNTNYAFLKAIENGAGLYFTLTYDNTTKFKEDHLLSQYYSISYEIWYKELVEVYTELNMLLKDVQTKIIIDHQFLRGERVPDADELEADILAMAEKALKEEEQAVKDAAVAAIEAVANARSTLVSSATSVANVSNSVSAVSNQLALQYQTLQRSIQAIADAKQALIDKQIPVETLTKAYEEAVELYSKAAADYSAHKKDVFDVANKAFNEAYAAGRTQFATAASAIVAYKGAKDNFVTSLVALEAAAEALENAKLGNDEAAIQAAQAAYDAAAATHAANEQAVKDKLEAYNALEGESAEAKQFFAQLVALCDNYATENYNSKALMAKATKLNEKQIAVAAALTEARNEVVLAEDAVTAAITAVNNISNALINLYKAIVNQVERSAVPTFERAKAAVEVLQTYTNVPESILAEGMENFNAIINSFTEASINSIKVIPSILSAVNETTVYDLESVNSYKTDLEAAAAALKEAIAKYQSVTADENSTAAQINNAKSAYKTARANLDTIIAGVVAAANISADKVLNANNAYASALLYKAQAEAAKDLTADEKAGIDASIAAIKAEAEKLNAAHNALLAVVEDYNNTLGDVASIVVNSVIPETPSAPVLPDSGEETEEEIDDTTKYTNDNGNIVLVTYGGKNGVDNDPYKSFILNFNYFAVVVELGGEVYTIPANGYVVIYR